VTEPSSTSEVVDVVDEKIVHEGPKGEPRSAVQQADALVSEVIEQIRQVFAKEHSSLESQWKQGDDVSADVMISR
jgi:hypothetical protein